jgi:hypothetical protein
LNQVPLVINKPARGRTNVDHYLDDQTWNDLVDRIAGQHDANEEGWTARDETILALGEAGIWPAAISAREEV